MSMICSYGKLQVAILAAAAVFSLSSCSEKEDVKTEYRFRFTEDATEIVLGGTYNCSFEYSENGGTYAEYSLYDNPLEISLTCTDTKVATVNQSGKVRTLSEGSALVIAESATTQQKDTLTITVTSSSSSSTVTADETSFNNASWNWKEFGNGAMYGQASISMFSSTQSISIVKYPESKYTTSIVYNSGNSCVIAGTAATAVSGAMAINGSFFNTTTLVSSTTFWNYGKLESTASDSESTNRSTGIVAFKDGKIDFDSYSSSSLTTWEKNYDAFISSGPLLVLDGDTQSFIDRDFNTARHPRSMIGVTKDRTIMMVVVDGRFTGKADGMTIPEMAKIAQYLKLTDAINLDGGGSSTLWTATAGVLNYPCDNGSWDHSGCRKVPTVIVAK